MRLCQMYLRESEMIEAISEIAQHAPGCRFVA